MIRRLIPLLAALAAPAPAIAQDCAAQIAAVAQRHKAAAPYRVETAFTVNGERRKTVTQVVPPDRIHQIKTGGETLIVGNAMWLKDRGKWQRAPVVVTPADIDTVHFDLAAQIAAASRMQCLGMRQRGGKDFFAYRFVSRHKVGSWDAIWDTELVVDAVSGLPVTAETNKGAPTAFVDTYTYDKTITLAAPQ